MTRNIARILVPTDFSTTSDAALDVGKTFAQQFGASLHVLHVLEDPYATAAYVPEVYVQLSPEMRYAALRDAERRLAGYLNESEKAGILTTTEVATGPTATQIVEYAAADAIDLIVMGTHGRTGMAHLMLGSVAEHVVRTAPCPVLTVRQTPAAAEQPVRARDVATPVIA